MKGSKSYFPLRGIRFTHIKVYLAVVITVFGGRGPHSQEMISLHLLSFSSDDENGEILSNNYRKVINKVCFGGKTLIMKRVLSSRRKKLCGIYC